MKKVRKAVIPVAGLGTRFLPFTKSSPKELLPIVNRPTLQLIVEEASAAGIDSILFITNRGKGAIEDHFDHNIELEDDLRAKGKTEALEEVQAINRLARIYTVRQHVTMGLGHAILQAKDFVGDEPFAILLGDDLVYDPDQPAIGQMIQVYQEVGTSVVGCQLVDHDQINKYGSLDGEKIGEDLYLAHGMVEKPAPEDAPSDVAILGRHVFDPSIFSYLDRVKPGVGGEIQLTDAMNEMAEEGKLYAYLFKGRRYDIGNEEGFLEANIEYALRNPRLRDRFAAYLRQMADGGRF